jgi:hypothetical protein
MPQCQFCFKEMFHVYTDSQDYRCDFCHSYQRAFNDGYLLWLYHPYSNVTVRFDHRSSMPIQSSITFWETTSDGFEMAMKTLHFPRILSITPNNIIEKIKLYLVLS